MTSARRSCAEGACDRANRAQPKLRRDCHFRAAARHQSRHSWRARDLFQHLLLAAPGGEAPLAGAAIRTGTPPFAAVFAPILAKRWGKRDACVRLFLAAIALGNLPLVAGLLGWMPPAGSQAQFAILLADLSVATFIGTSGFIIVTSMVADIVEEAELRTGRRSEGLLLAADTFLQKLSAGMAIAVPGLLLALVAFPPHADPTTLNPQVMRRLAFVSLPLWVALSLAATGMLLFYRIDRRTHEANLALLESRRAHPASA
jgi:glycoside/pentoside/hexuronide:cation symporter, GPH family